MCEECDGIGWVYKNDIQEGNADTLIGVNSQSLWVELFQEWERFLICPFCDGFGWGK